MFTQRIVIVPTLSLLVWFATIGTIAAAPEAPVEDPTESPKVEISPEEMDDPNSVDAAEEEDSTPESEANLGQADLDKATELKLTAENGKDIGDVIRLLASALQKGLDEENTKFAQQMLSATLMERGKGLATVLLQQPVPNAARNPRWLQLKMIALSDLTNAVDLDEAEYEGWLLIGRLQQLPGGDPKAAAAAFAKVIDAEEVDQQLKAEAYLYRAITQSEEEDKLADMSKAIELDDNNAGYRLLRARQYFANKALDKALADADAAIEIADENPTAHELRGLILREMGDSEAALLSFDRASELDPDTLMPYLQRSELYGQLGNLEQGIDQATKAIDRNEDNPISYLLRAELYLRNSQPEEALADTEKVLELQPGYAPAIWLKARIYDEMGDTRQALEQLEALGSAIPQQMELNLQIAIYALQLEMPRRAIAALDRAIEIEPDNAVLHRYRGDARLNIGQHVEAVADYEKALELEPEDSGILNNLAWTLATSPSDEVRDGSRAVELATKACELTDYETPHILSTLAAAHAEAGDFEKAIKWSRQAVEIGDLENDDQLAKELASYENGEPWRESHSLDSGEREGAESTAKNDPRRSELEKPSSSTPAPRRSIDF